ncbi:hypothetical protein GIB67_042410 [Kingdonia uniflora]|uniref:Uncharacterized protein n=1 Tax=Kingdonia uniflora TaxID=39325 RepID=A0A7J7M866_9MAGN|nr:hypothetical protein GIB67_042410 [Kingdonia uniflora]
MQVCFVVVTQITGSTGRPQLYAAATKYSAGIQGFFITCDGGRERQAAHEAINVIDTLAFIFHELKDQFLWSLCLPLRLDSWHNGKLFLEELVDGGDSGTKCKSELSKPLNKITKFSDSDSDSSSDDEKESNPQNEEQTEHENTDDMKETPLKKQCLDTKISKCENVVSDKREKPIDELIEAELKDLKDRSKHNDLQIPIKLCSDPSKPIMEEEATKNLTTLPVEEIDMEHR